MKKIGIERADRTRGSLLLRPVSLTRACERTMKKLEERRDHDGSVRNRNTIDSAESFSLLKVAGNQWNRKRFILYLATSPLKLPNQASTWP